MDFTAVPNPALEPWDPIRIRYSDRDGIELHLIESITVPLVADAPLTATTREQTVVLVGNQLGNSVDTGGDTGDLHCHGFHEYHRNAFSEAGQGEDPIIRAAVQPGPGLTVPASDIVRHHAAGPNCRTPELQHKEEV